MDQANSSNDYELLYMVYQMDEDSLRELIYKYQKVAKRLIRYYLSASRDLRYEEDLLLDSMQYLYQAIYRYRQDKNCSFSTFVRNILVHRIANFYRNFSSYKGNCEKYSLSLDHYVNEEESVLPYTVNHDKTLEGSHVLYVEGIKYELRKILQPLAEWERKVILLRLTGYSYQEIANMLGVEYRQVEYVLAKTKNKRKL